MISLSIEYYRYLFLLSSKFGNIATLKQLVDEMQVPVDTTDHRGWYVLLLSILRIIMFHVINSLFDN